MFESKIPLDKAEKEVADWLEFKRVVPSTSEKFSQQLSLITEHIMYGTLIVNEDRSFTHSLLFPVVDSQGDIHLDKLTYKARLTSFDLDQKMKGVKTGDADGRMKAYMSALTGRSFGDLGKLDTADLAIAEAILVFFT